MIETQDNITEIFYDICRKDWSEKTLLTVGDLFSENFTKYFCKKPYKKKEE